MRAAIGHRACRSSAHVLDVPARRMAVAALFPAAGKGKGT
jgi:hypothetical protein